MAEYIPGMAHHPGPDHSMFYNYQANLMPCNPCVNQTVVAGRACFAEITAIVYLGERNIATIIILFVFLSISYVAKTVT